MKPGDWSCPNCGDHQFARNQHCRRCGTPNPNPGGGMDGGKGWDCDGGKGWGMGMDQPWGAGFQKGYAPMKGGKGQMMGKGGSGDQGGQPTSWKCPACGELVFARNTECKSCG